MEGTRASRGGGRLCRERRLARMTARATLLAGRSAFQILKIRPAQCSYLSACASRINNLTETAKVRWLWCMCEPPEHLCLTSGEIPHSASTNTSFARLPDDADTVDVHVINRLLL